MCKCKGSLNELAVDMYHYWHDFTGVPEKSRIILGVSSIQYFCIKNGCHDSSSADTRKQGIWTQRTEGHQAEQIQFVVFI